MLPIAAQRSALGSNAGSPACWQGVVLVDGAGAAPVATDPPDGRLPLSLKLPLPPPPSPQAMLFVGWDLAGQQGLNTMDRGWGSTWTKVCSLAGWEAGWQRAAEGCCCLLGHRAHVGSGCLVSVLWVGLCRAQHV